MSPDKKNANQQGEMPAWQHYFNILKDTHDREIERVEEKIEEKFNTLSEDINSVSQETQKTKKELSDKIDVFSKTNEIKLDEIDETFRGNGKIGIFEQLRNIRTYIKIIFILIMLLYGFKVWGLGLDDFVKSFIETKPNIVVNTPNKNSIYTTNKIDVNLPTYSNTQPTKLIEDNK